MNVNVEFFNKDKKQKQEKKRLSGAPDALKATVPTEKALPQGIKVLLHELFGAFGSSCGDLIKSMLEATRVDQDHKDEDKEFVFNRVKEAIYSNEHLTMEQIFATIKNAIQELYSNDADRHDELQKRLQELREAHQSKDIDNTVVQPSENEAGAPAPTPA
jgi:hypothetical protein